MGCAASVAGVQHGRGQACVAVVHVEPAADDGCCDAGPLAAGGPGSSCASSAAPGVCQDFGPGTTYPDDTGEGPAASFPGAVGHPSAPHGAGGGFFGGRYESSLARERRLFEELAAMAPEAQAAYRQEHFCAGKKVTGMAHLKPWAVQGGPAQSLPKPGRDGTINLREGGRLYSGDLAPRFACSDAANNVVRLWRGDITTLQVDAIVNAANTGLWAGGGICGAIHKASGPLLAEECQGIGRPPERCRTGNTVITQGYRLPAEHVLHTVGPTSIDKKALQSSYKTTLDLAAEHRLRSVALCCVSTGIFGFPLRLATHIAFSTVRTWLDNHPGVLDCVVFTVFMPKELEVYQSLMPSYFPRRGEAELPKRGPPPPPVPESPREYAAVGGGWGGGGGRPWGGGRQKAADGWSSPSTSRGHEGRATGGDRRGGSGGRGWFRSQSPKQSPARGEEPPPRGEAQAQRGKGAPAGGAGR